jgi:hypothetical protein
MAMASKNNNFSFLKLKLFIFYFLPLQPDPSQNVRTVQFSDWMSSESLGGSHYAVRTFNLIIMVISLPDSQ